MAALTKCNECIDITAWKAYHAFVAMSGYRIERMAIVWKQRKMSRYSILFRFFIMYPGGIMFLSKCIYYSLVVHNCNLGENRMPIHK